MKVTAALFLLGLVLSVSADVERDLPEDDNVTPYGIVEFPEDDIELEDAACDDYFDGEYDLEDAEYDIELDDDEDEEDEFALAEIEEEEDDEACGKDLLGKKQRKCRRKCRKRRRKCRRKCRKKRRKCKRACRKEKRACRRRLKCFKGCGKKVLECLGHIAKAVVDGYTGDDEKDKQKGYEEAVKKCGKGAGRCFLDGFKKCKPCRVAKRKCVKKCRRNCRKACPPRNCRKWCKRNALLDDDDDEYFDDDDYYFEDYEDTSGASGVHYMVAGGSVMVAVAGIFALVKIRARRRRYANVNTLV